MLTGPANSDGRLAGIAGLYDRASVDLLVARGIRLNVTPCGKDFLL